MSRIGIDVDGVLRDFCGDLVSIVKKEYPQYIKGNPDEFVIDTWSLAESFNCSKQELQQIYWYSHCDKIMGNGAPMYGAIKQMYDLFDWADEKGHSLVCVTSQQPHIRHYTLSWLGKYGLNFDTVYFTRGRHKWRTPVDYLVDDSPENFDNWVRGRGMQEGYILMDHIYNQHTKSSYRIKELKQVKEIIDG